MAQKKVSVVVVALWHKKKCQLLLVVLWPKNKCPLQSVVVAVLRGTKKRSLSLLLLLLLMCYAPLARTGPRGRITHPHIPQNAGRVAGRGYRRLKLGVPALSLPPAQAQGEMVHRGPTRSLCWRLEMMMMMLSAGGFTKERERERAREREREREKESSRAARGNSGGIGVSSGELGVTSG